MFILKMGILLIILIILFFFLKYLHTNWKSLKKAITDGFYNNLGSIFYICLFFVFFIFTVYPLLINYTGSTIESSKKQRTYLLLFMIILNIIYIFWIYKLYVKPGQETNGFLDKILYIIQFIIILYALIQSSYNYADTFPQIPFFNIQNTPQFITVFWIFYWVVLSYSTYYLFKIRKSDSNNITTTSINQTTLKYLGIFIILLFTTKLLFFKEIIVSSKEREILAFNTPDSFSYITYLAYFLIIINIIYLIFNSSIIKWIEYFILIVIIILIIIVALFKILLNFTNPTPHNNVTPSDFSYFNANYIFLFILFLFSFLILFKLNPSHFLQSSMNYVYIIGFVFGLIVLFSLSLLFNNDETVKEVLNGEYSTYIKYGIVAFLSFAFLYFLAFYVKKGISTFQNADKSNPILFATSSILNIGLLLGLFAGIYFFIKMIRNETPILNVSILTVIIIICFTIFKSTINIFDSHNNTRACPINIELWKWREITIGIFLIIGIFALNSVKNATPQAKYTDIGLAIVFVILGYYIGGYLYNIKEKNKMLDAPVKTSNCSNFLNDKAKLSFLETIKVVIMVSIVVVLFFSMNILVKNLSTTTLDNTNLTYFLGIFFILLFYIYIKFSNTSFSYIIELFDNICSRKYFSSPNTHKLNDFLFLIFVIIVFFSSMGLIERVVVSKIIQTPLDYIGNVLGLTANNAHSNVLKKLYYLVLLSFNIIMYIPCIFNDMYKHIYENTKKSNTFVYILIIEFCLILFYILYRKFVSLIVYQHTELLLNDPEWLYPPTILSNTAQITQNENGIQANIPQTPTYHFGISCWIYIEPGAANTFLNILNYNNSPAILYKPSMNSLIVSSQLNPENVDTEYKFKGTNTQNALADETIKSFTTLNNNKHEGIKDRKIVFTTDIKLQTWNNIFVNYNDGTIDVFINGKLMKSDPGNMIDASTYKNLITIGDNNENIQMKICNLCFYNKNLDLDEIIQVYDSYKNLNPPLRH